MDLFAILSHCLDFTAPAAFVAMVMAVSARWVLPGARMLPSFPRLAGACFLTGLAVLVAGLVVFGRDGKMLTYGAMVLACGTLPWLLGRGWRG